MLITRAPLATAQRIAFASASTGIERCGPTTFAIRSSAGGARPGDADAVVRLALRSGRRRTSRGPACRPSAGPRRSSSRRRSGRAARDGCRRCPSRSRRPGPRRAAAARSTRRTSGSAPRTTAAARNGSFGTYDCLRGCRAPRRSARPARRAAPPRSAAVTASAAIGARSTMRGRAARRELLARPPRGRRSARSRRRTGPPSRRRRPRRGRARRPRRAAAALADHFAGPAGTVIVSAGPAWPSAVSRYVAVTFGRTVTANEPSSVGRDLDRREPGAVGAELLEQRRLRRRARARRRRRAFPAAAAAGGRPTRSTPSRNAVERRPSRARTSAALSRILSPVFLTSVTDAGRPEAVGTTTTSTTGAESPNACASEAAVNERGSQRW